MAKAKLTAQGTWRVQIEISGTRKSKTFENKDDAEGWAAEQTARLRRQKSMRLREATEALSNIIPKRLLAAARNLPVHLEDVLASAAPASSFTGIYFLIFQQDVVYVGQSIDVLGRISRHKREGKEFDSYSYILCQPEKLNELESAYIASFMPWLNFTLGRPVRNI